MGFFSKVFGRGKKKDEDDLESGSEEAQAEATPELQPAPSPTPKTAPRAAPRAEAAPATNVEVSHEASSKVEVNLEASSKVEVNFEPEPILLSRVKEEQRPQQAVAPDPAAMAAAPMTTPVPEQRAVPEQASANAASASSSGMKPRATSGSQRSVSNQVECDGCHRELPVPLPGHPASVTCPFCLTRNAYRP